MNFILNKYCLSRQQNYLIQNVIQSSIQSQSIVIILKINNYQNNIHIYVGIIKLIYVNKV